MGRGMFVYRQTQIGLWVVGFYEPGTNKWIPESEHYAPNEAAARTAWLNGARMTRAPKVRRYPNGEKDKS